MSKRNLDSLVAGFAAALLQKLLAAEEKYGFDDDWQRTTWENELRESLRHHVEKGDPLDVAAYAAFAWYHGWSTSSNLKDREIAAAREYVVKAFPNDANSV